MKLPVNCGRKEPALEFQFSCQRIGVAYDLIIKKEIWSAVYQEILRQPAGP
jgi:hypothetical protein